MDGDTELTAEYYARLAKERPKARILGMGGIELTFQQAADEVRKGTPSGQALVQTHGLLLEEMRKRIG